MNSGEGNAYLMCSNLIEQTPYFFNQTASDSYQPFIYQRENEFFSSKENCSIVSDISCISSKGNMISSDFETKYSEEDSQSNGSLHSCLSYFDKIFPKKSCSFEPQKQIELEIPTKSQELFQLKHEICFELINGNATKNEAEKAATADENSSSDNSKNKGRMKKSKLSTLPIELQYTNKMRADNVMNKIKTCFFKFLFDFLNIFSSQHAVSFINIKRSIKDRIKSSCFRQMTVREIVQVQNEKRNGLDAGRNYNKETYEKARSIDELSDFFDMTLHEFFVRFFVGLNNEKFEQKYGIQLKNLKVKPLFFDDLASDKNKLYNERIRNIMEHKFLN